MALSGRDRKIVRKIVNWDIGLRFYAVHHNSPG